LHLFHVLFHVQCPSSLPPEWRRAAVLRLCLCIPVWAHPHRARCFGARAAQGSGRHHSNGCGISQRKPGRSSRQARAVPNVLESQVWELFGNPSCFLVARSCMNVEFLCCAVFNALESKVQRPSSILYSFLLHAMWISVCCSHPCRAKCIQAVVLIACTSSSRYTTKISGKCWTHCNKHYAVQTKK